MVENGVFACVPFCFRSLGCFERCAEEWKLFNIVMVLLTSYSFSMTFNKALYLTFVVLFGCGVEKEKGVFLMFSIKNTACCTFA